MNTRYKILLITFLSLAIGISACKEEKKTLKNPKTSKKIVKVKPVQKKIEKEVPETILNKAVHKYFLVVASFKNQANAEKMKSKLISEGYDSKIILSKNHFYRVSYKGFVNKKEAFNELKRARSTEERKDVWLHIKH